MYYSIDSIEGNAAKLVDDDDGIVMTSLSALPHGVHEGDIVRLSGTQYVLDAKETQLRRARIRAKLDKLINSN